jgi:hypothetical protein
MIWIVILVIFIVVAFLLLRGWAKGLDSPAPAQFENFDDGGSFNQEVVGEASYQEALRSIAGRGEVRHECRAVLSLEDSNPHDSNAVAVLVDGKRVGYLSRSDANRYRKKLAPTGAFGTCPAVIVGGGNQRNLGIWLDIRF